LRFPGSGLHSVIHGGPTKSSLKFIRHKIHLTGLQCILVFFEEQNGKRLVHSVTLIGNSENFFQIYPKKNWHKAEISEEKNFCRVTVVQPDLQSQWPKSKKRSDLFSPNPGLGHTRSTYRKLTRFTKKF